MPLSPGTKLGQYEVVEAIGAGGMGEVYRARDTKLGRDVAIKVLPEEFARDKERLDRFEREARLLAQVNHANIATLHGLEEHDEQKFIIMELVEGETLAERIAKGRIPLDEAIPLFIQIAEGLEAAHEKGIIHRDLKPANIKIGPDRKPKILDFGLAKAFAGETPRSSQTESPTVTRQTEAGVILGTAPYMSPEQARGKTLDKRTDIWSFACVLYEALTGRVPFLGETVSDTIARILEREPDWDALPERSSSQLIHLLRRCFQKQPEQRLRDVGDARLELADIFARSDAELESSIDRRPPARRSAALFVMGTIALASLALTLWSSLRPRASQRRPVSRFAIPLEPDAELSFDTLASVVAISPDGRQIAYVAARGTSTQIYLRDLERSAAVPIDGGADGRMPFFSADSQWLGFERGTTLMSGGLMKVSVTGGAPVLISESGVNPRGASWSEIGIVFTPSTSSGLARVSAEGGDPEILVAPKRERREKTFRLPNVLPGGKAVLFTLGTADIETYDDASIALLSLETGNYRVLIEGGMHGRYVSSGHLVYARASTLLAVPFDLSELEVVGAPVPVVENVVTNANTGTAHFSVSREGSLIYVRRESIEQEHRVMLVDRAGNAETLFAVPRVPSDVRFSPDGRSLALDLDGGNASVWLHDLVRGTLTPIVTGFDNLTPIWGPMGDRIAFRSNRDGVFNLFLHTVEGDDEPLRLTTSEYFQHPASWSTDGRFLAFRQTGEGSGMDLWVLPLDGDDGPQPFLQTSFNERFPVFSPHGRWIAYDSDESGEYEVYVRRYPESTGKRQVSVGGGTQPMWNRSGGELFYRNGDAMMVVDVAAGNELALGRPRMLFEKPWSRSLTFRNWDAAPDGQHFVMLERSREPLPSEIVFVQNWFEELERLVPTN